MKEDLTLDPVGLLSLTTEELARISMKARRSITLVVAVTFAAVFSAAAPAQVSQRCPSGSVLSDSAYHDAPAVKEFLAQHGYVVRCITSSKMEGTAQLRDVAGFQADQGTFTVFFLPRGEDIKVSETPASHGYYRYTFVRTIPGHRPLRYAYKSNGREYYLRHGDWLLLVWDARIADQLRDIL
jgi:hypothetical protein